MSVMASPRGFVVRLASRSTLITRPPHIIPTLYDTFQRRENKHFPRLVPRAPLERCLVVERGGTTHLRSVQLRCSVARAPCLFCISAPSAKGVFISPNITKYACEDAPPTPLRTPYEDYHTRTCSLTRVGDTMPLETLEAQKSSCSEPTPVVWSATTSPLASSTVEHSSPTSPLDVAGDT